MTYSSLDLILLALRQYDHHCLLHFDDGLCGVDRICTFYRALALLRLLKKFAIFQGFPWFFWLFLAFYYRYVLVFSLRRDAALLFLFISFFFILFWFFFLLVLENDNVLRSRMHLRKLFNGACRTSIELLIYGDSLIVVEDNVRCAIDWCEGYVIKACWRVALLHVSRTIKTIDIVSQIELQRLSFLLVSVQLVYFFAQKCRRVRILGHSIFYTLNTHANLLKLFILW